MAMKLLSLGVNPNTITISGHSGGSYMSTLVHVAHSATIKGVGLMKGGPYLGRWNGIPTAPPLDDAYMNTVYDRVA